MTFYEIPNPESYRAFTVVGELIRVMGLDNNVCFHPPRDQVIRLVNVVMSMMEEGMAFTESDILLIAAGEESEVQAAYGKFSAFPYMQEILKRIFEGPTLP